MNGRPIDERRQHRCRPAATRSTRQVPRRRAPPGRAFDFCTGRPLAERLGYPRSIVDALPGRAIESSAGIGNPFALRPLHPGENVLDVGCGAEFDAFVAAHEVGPAGQVIGIDRTPEMVAKAQATAEALGLSHIEFRQAFAEALPVDHGWADVVVSKRGHQPVPRQARRVRRDPPHCVPAARCNSLISPNGDPVPPEALRDIDLRAA